MKGGPFVRQPHYLFSQELTHPRGATFQHPWMRFRCLPGQEQGGAVRSLQQHWRWYRMTCLSEISVSIRWGGRVCNVWTLYTFFHQSTASLLEICTSLFVSSWLRCSAGGRRWRWRPTRSIALVPGFIASFGIMFCDLKSSLFLPLFFLSPCYIFLSSMIVYFSIVK